MSWELYVLEPDDLARYAAVPMTIRVESALKPVPLRGGLGGLRLEEEPLAVPYEKDYDQHGGPASWPARFDLSRWHIVAVIERGVVLAGAAAFGPALAHADTVAELWDIRVRPEARRSGFGRLLLGHQQEWARQQGYRWLKAETQNVNVAACRFYQHEGALLGAINIFAYSGQADVEQEVELDWFCPLASG